MRRLAAWGRGLKSRLALFLKAGRFPNRLDESDRRLVVQSLVIGVVVWGPVFLLQRIIHETFAFILELIGKAPSTFLILIPLWLGSLTTALIANYRRRQIIHYQSDGKTHELSDVEGDGLERAIALYHAAEPSFEKALLGKEGVEVRWELPTFSLAARKFAATWATLGSGGSGGLEGSVALIGEGLAASMFKPRPPMAWVGDRFEWLSRPLRWWSAQDVDHLQTAQLCGIAAAIATLTGAPFMSAFFAAEVMYRRRPLIEKLIYSLISTLIAYFLSSLVNFGHSSLFQTDLVYLPSGEWQYYGLVAISSLSIAIISVYFTRLRGLIEAGFDRYVSNLWARHLLGATLIGLIALIAVALAGRYSDIGRPDAFELVLGTGSGAIDAALAGKLTIVLATIALCGKILTTLLTIGSGGSAGFLIPALFLGAMVATIVATAAHYEPMLLIAPAMTASLVSLVNVPLAAILLPVEMFSSHYLPAALLALLICTFLTQNDKLYRTQRETFDKRQIIPGVEVRRVLVPVEWDRKTLVELNLRRRFDVTVIGILEIHGVDGAPQIRLDPSAMLTLRQGDTIVVMGSEENLNRLENVIRVQESYPYNPRVSQAPDSRDVADDHQPPTEPPNPDSQ